MIRPYKRHDLSALDVISAGEKTAYPCVIELGLDADVFAFLLILRSKNLQLCRLERAIVSQ